MNNAPPVQTLFICRPEFSDALLDELRDQHDIELKGSSPAPGLLLVESNAPLSPEPCIFERQRLSGPAFTAASALKPIADETITSVFRQIIKENPLWTVHLISHEGQTEDSDTPSRKLDGIWNTLLRLGRKVAPDLEKRHRAPHRLKTGGLVLQLLMTNDGAWHSIMRIEELSDPRPGGIARMKFDTNAPSRSYLKIEEALDRMPQQPEAGAHVIDLGAAPGGWTYAFVKRGCDVLSVDHDPMKLPEHQDGWGRVTHLQQNGITFEPPSEWAHVDWLIADMLIAPGVAQGLLRRWLLSEKAKQIICNVKLPQSEPYKAIQPLIEMLKTQQAYRYTIKQLYHDRREVTVMMWK